MKRPILKMLTTAALITLLSVNAWAATCTEHNFQRISEPATCTEPGYQGYQCCACGLLWQMESIPELGHDWAEWTEISAPSCTSEGVEQAKCSRCGQEQFRSIDQTPHDYAVSVVEPTCAKDGYTLYACKNCGREVKEDAVPKLEHDYAVSVVEPTCTKDGYTLYACKNCGREVKEDTVPKLEHDYAVSVVEPTCTKDGYTLYACKNCGREVKEDAVPKLEHHYTVWVQTPTCTKDGYTRYSCTRCSHEIKTDQISATGHAYVTTVTAPTCTADGYTRHECVNCGDAYRTDPVKKTGHHYDNGVITKEPTWTAMGRKTFTCYGCGDTYQETTPKLSNPFVDVAEGAYFYDSVIWAVAMQITNGTDDTHFTPDAACTRGQVVTFLWRQAGQPQPDSGKCSFVDISEDSYYYTAVLWAVEQGITNGTDATHFSPNLACTRCQVVTFLYRAKGSPSPKNGCGFLDVSTSAYYYRAVCWASEKGITTGTGAATFSPNNPCTRGQIVTFLYRAKDK